MKNSSYAKCPQSKKTIGFINWSNCILSYPIVIDGKPFGLNWNSSSNCGEQLAIPFPVAPTIGNNWKFFCQLEMQLEASFPVEPTIGHNWKFLFQLEVQLEASFPVVGAIVNLTERALSTAYTYCFTNYTDYANSLSKIKIYKRV